MFPAYKPTEIPLLPLGLYLDMVRYWKELNQKPDGPVPQFGDGFLNTPGEHMDVDFDSTYGIGKGKRGH